MDHTLVDKNVGSELARAFAFPGDPQSAGRRLGRHLALVKSDFWSKIEILTKNPTVRYA